MTEILTWGYAFLNGVEGVKFKIKGFVEGTTAKVEKIKCNRKKLLKSLEWKIPEEQLNYNLFDRILKRVANFVYRTNYRLVSF